jgi:hypothetical protein
VQGAAVIPVFQTLTTVNDGKGNCFIACVASIMELPLREMPDLANDLNGGQYFIALEQWMAPRGLFPTHHTTAPKGWSVAGGYLGKERLPHAVVAYNGRPVHDPYPLGGELSDADSWWTIDPISEAQRKTVEAM